MCRLIFARGVVPTDDILAAALAMSTGQTADHDGPIRCHPNGWGAIWRDPAAPGGLAVHRDTRSMSLSDAPLARVRTDTLAVHVRHATVARNVGLQFTHPLYRPGAVPWYLMHNGFLPTVHRALGLAESRFDSAEYFDYLIPPGTRSLDRAATLRRLHALQPGGTSGNAIAMNAEGSYIVHWSPSGSPYPRYVAMHRLRLPDLLVVASEIIPALARRDRWEPLPPDLILEFAHSRRSSERTHHDRYRSTLGSSGMRCEPRRPGSHPAAAAGSR